MGGGVYNQTKLQVVWDVMTGNNCLHIWLLLCDEVKPMFILICFYRLHESHMKAVKWACTVEWSKNEKQIRLSIDLLLTITSGRKHTKQM